jgi:hypothetical protein
MEILAVAVFVVVVLSLVAIATYALLFVIAALRIAVGAGHETLSEELDRVLTEILGPRDAPAPVAGHTSPEARRTTRIRPQRLNRRPR